MKKKNKKKKLNYLLREPITWTIFYKKKKKLIFKIKFKILFPLSSRDPLFF